MSSPYQEVEIHIDWDMSQWSLANIQVLRRIANDPLEDLGLPMEGSQS